MNISAPSAAALAANTAIVDRMASADHLAQVAHDQLAQGTTRGVRESLRDALSAAEDAADGAARLGDSRVLDLTTIRWARHAVARLDNALSLAQIVRNDVSSRTRLTEAISDALVATGLCVDFGHRALANPVLQTSRGSSTSGSGDGWSPTSGPDRDGTSYDGAGYPVPTGGGTWAGPDGERYDGAGNPATSGGEVYGPDGTYTP